MGGKGGGGSQWQDGLPVHRVLDAIDAVAGFEVKACPGNGWTTGSHVISYGILQKVFMVPDLIPAPNSAIAVKRGMPRGLACHRYCGAAWPMSSLLRLQQRRMGGGVPRNRP